MNLIISLATNFEFVENCNDGRSKGFYCNAVNLLSLSNLKGILGRIKKKILNLNIDPGEKTALIVDLFEAVSKKAKIDLKLRKQPANHA